jgi:hypothetical protein
MLIGVFNHSASDKQVCCRYPQAMGNGDCLKKADLIPIPSPAQWRGGDPLGDRRSGRGEALIQPCRYPVWPFSSPNIWHRFQPGYNA